MEVRGGDDGCPVENAFAKLKADLRTAAERTVGGLWDAVGRIIDTYTPTESTNYFTAAGCLRPDRLTPVFWSAGDVSIVDFTMASTCRAALRSQRSWAGPEIILIPKAGPLWFLRGIEIVGSCNPPIRAGLLSSACRSSSFSLPEKPPTGTISPTVSVGVVPLAAVDAGRINVSPILKSVEAHSFF